MSATSPLSWTQHPSLRVDDAEQDERSGTKAIIDALAHLQHPGPSDEEAELDEWSIDQLKAEVLRLRHLNHASSTRSTPLEPPPLIRPKRKRGKEKARTDSPSKEKGKKSRVIAERDEGTGKRLERGRRTELSKAIRAKVRAICAFRRHTFGSQPSFFVWSRADLLLA